MTRMYFFILHLSIADLLTAIGTLLPEFVWTFTFPKFYGGNVGCKLMKYFFMVGPYLSSYTLVMTAVDRYQVTKVRPTHPAKIDLNKKCLPKQRAIQNFNIDAQGFRKTRN